MLKNFEFMGEKIPEYMEASIRAYCVEHLRPGSFLEAVISNDLKKAVECADENNIRILHVYVSFFYNYTPADCWGSADKFNNWLKDKEHVS